MLHENMTLIHLLLDNNKFEGSIPSTLGLVTPMEVLDMSNNSFDPSDAPSWFTELPALTTLVMEGTKLEGEVPESLFSLPQSETVILKRNNFGGTFDLGAGQSKKLRLVDMQNNNISAFTQRSHHDDLQLILVGNPYCSDARDLMHCVRPDQSSVSYTTPPQDCTPANCDSDKVSSPNCDCSHHYIGSLVFRAPKFSDLENPTYYKDLEEKFMKTFKSTTEIPVDSVAVTNISRSPKNYLEMNLLLFPLDQNRFNRTAISTLGFMLSNQTIKPPSKFGPFYFTTAEPYTTFADITVDEPKKSFSMTAIIGIAAGGCVLVILVCVGAIICVRKKRNSKTVEPAKSFSFASGTSWMSPQSSIATLPLAGSRMFSLEEIKKMTNNYAVANIIGSGTYGKLYLLPFELCTLWLLIQTIIYLRFNGK